MNISRFKSLLRRETSSGSFIPEVDGLRFIAIGSVFLYHLNDYLVHKLNASKYENFSAEVLDNGFIGVQLFFAISAFVVGLPFASKYLKDGKSIDLGFYFVRRLVRLEPPYLINLAVLFFLKVATGAYAIEKLLPHLAASATYTHNLIYREHSLVNGVAWSLEIEFQFYLLAPAIAWAFFGLRNPMVRRLGAGALVIVYGWLIRYLAGNWLELTLISQFHWFLTGLILVDLYVSGDIDCQLREWRWDAAAVLGCLALFGSAETNWINVIGPPGVALLFVGALRGKLSARVFRSPPVYLIGGMCYTLYLYHFFVISAVGKLVWPLLSDQSVGYDLILFLMALVTGLATIAAGAVFFICLERPFMNRYWARKVAGYLRAEKSTG